MKKALLKNNSLGLKWIWLSFPFLMNPNISVFDFLPDFIGYMILCYGFSKIADLNESIENAVSVFRKMILVDLGKWLAILWIFGLTVPSERNSSLLLFTFVFSVAEMILLIPAYSKLFYGITQLGFLFPNQSILSAKDDSKKSRTDRMKRLTVWFVGVKAVLAVLPEMAELTNGDYSELSATRSLYNYIGVMRLFAFIPVLILGIVWCVMILQYFARIRKDTQLIRAMEEKYVTSVLPKKGLFLRRSFGYSFLLLIIALILSADFRLENRNMLPDFLVPIAMTLVFCFLSRHVPIKQLPWIGSVSAYFVISLVAYGAELRFFKEFYYGAIIRNDTARTAYTVLTALDALKAVAFVVMIWVLIRALYTVVLRHTGFVAGREHVSEREEKMIGDLHREQWHLLLIAFAFAVLYAISDVCFVILAPEYGFMGLINMIFAAGCIGAFFRAMSVIQDAIQTKYMLE